MAVSPFNSRTLAGVFKLRSCETVSGSPILLCSWGVVRYLDGGCRPRLREAGRDLFTGWFVSVVACQSGIGPVVC